MSLHRTQIVAKHDISITDIDYLENRLYDHNRVAVGRDDGLTLAFVALDSDGVQVGAIAGYSWASMAGIRQLWVTETHRGQGLGRALLEAFITEAIKRRCLLVWVASYDFQAPGLYERCGFERVAELADWPPGHVNVILRRYLEIAE
jgi:GNAT superfamily N-acetyltransferase